MEFARCSDCKIDRYGRLTEENGGEDFERSSTNIEMLGRKRIISVSPSECNHLFDDLEMFDFIKFRKLQWA